MTTSLVLDSTLRRSAKLLEECERHLDLPGVPAAQQRLERSIRLARLQSQERPVLIALVGGSGAGKSELFNALLRTPGASPVSAAERLFTRHVYAAVLPVEAESIPLPPETSPVWVNHGVPGLALLDTPDLDGAVPENREKARLAIEAADLIVYVALPEKRSSFAIQQELKRWAASKQWFFVLNKIDLCSEGEIGQIRNDFAARIQELGFPASDSTLFIVSAKSPRHPYSELERLRSAIYSSRTGEEMHRVREVTVYRSLHHAISNETVDGLDRLREDLAASEAALTESVRATYLRVLSSRIMRDHLTEIVRARVWRQIPSRVGGFLALPLWVLARTNQIWLTFSLTRFVRGGFSLLGLAHSAWSAMVAYVRGVLPLQEMVAGFKRSDLAELRNLRSDAVRKLEDLGLRWEDASVAPPAAHAMDAVRNVDPNAGDAPARTNWTLPPEPDDPERRQILNCLLQAVERSSSEASSRAVSGWHRFFGNLLPLVVFVDVTRKAVLYWLEDAWLSGPFYLLAVFLFILSVIPGCFLVAAGVRARARVGKPEELIAGLEEPWEAEPVRETRLRVERFRSRVAQFQRELNERAQELAQALDPSRFGARPAERETSKPQNS